MYSEESCKGTTQAIEPDGGCTLLKNDLYECPSLSINNSLCIANMFYRRRKARGAKVPENVVCDFYG